MPKFLQKNQNSKALNITLGKGKKYTHKKK